jgi:hypothetical protein
VKSITATYFANVKIEINNGNRHTSTARTAAVLLRIIMANYAVGRTDFLAATMLIVATPVFMMEVASPAHAKT